MTSSYLLTAVTWAYLVVSLAYLGLLLFKKEILGQVGTLILWLTMATHATAIVVRWVEAGRPPLSNLYESLVFFAWTVAAAQLVIELFTKKRILGAFITPFAFLAMAYASFDPDVPSRIVPLLPALKSNWLIAHVIACFLGYAAFAIACGLAYVYLFQWAAKNKPVWIDWTIIAVLIVAALAVWLAFKWRRPILPVVIFAFSALPAVLYGIGSLLRARGSTIGGESSRLPGLDELHYLIYQTIVFGLILLTVGIATGAIWADKAWGRPWSWDPKETWSLITWFIYVLFPHLHNLPRFRGRYLAWVAVVGFFCVLFTYFAVNQLPGLHSYGR